jgi:hypothetical protein
MITARFSAFVSYIAGGASKISEPKSKDNDELDSDIVFKFDKESNSDELDHNYEDYELDFDSYSNGVIESDSN